MADIFLYAPDPPRGIPAAEDRDRPVRGRNRRGRILVLALAALCAARPAWSWGRQGHAEVARIAQANLAPAVLVQVQALLEGDLDAQGQPSGRRSLAAIASWPDEIRAVAPKGAFTGWHTRANPVCSAALGPCPDGHCVDELIEHYGRILQDPAQPRLARNEALKWVVHLVGDLHQPLHSGVAADGGHEPVHSIQGQRLKPGTTLHNVWDTQLARIALQGWHGGTRPADIAPGDRPRQWMLEARDVARHHVYEPLPGWACNQPLPAWLDLDDAYVQQAIPVIRHQIERAGFRLADELNRRLGSAPAPAAP